MAIIKTNINEVEEVFAKMDLALICEERYDSLINPNTVIMGSSQRRECKLSNNSIINVNNFTYKKPTITRCMLYGIKKSKKYYIYKDIKFRVFAELLIPKKGNFYDFLYSEERRGSCFLTGTEICFADENSKIITAMCVDPFLVPTKKFLHSFVIIKDEEGKEYVIDGTINAVIEKQKYFDIYGVKVVSEISSNELKNFFDIVTENRDLKVDASLAEYLCFPDEVMEGIKKYIKTR